MKKHKFVFIFIFFFLYQCQLFAQDYYIKTISITGTSSDNGLDILADETGYILMTGSITILSGSGILKTDLAGNLQWSNAFYTYPYDSGVNNLIELPNGSYLISGGHYTPTLSSQDLYTIISSTGDSIRSLSHGNELQNSAPFSILNGGHIISFTTFGSNTSSLDNLLLKLDTNLMVIRQDTILAIDDYTFNSSTEILLLPAQEYILGIGAQNEPDKIYGFLRKTDTIGNTIWEQPINNIGVALPPIHLANLKNGHFVASWVDSLGGITENRGSYFVRSYDTDGNIDWQYTFISSDYVRNIQDLYVCANGDIIGCGYTGNFALTGNPTCWLFRLSPNGELKWMREYVYWESLAQFMLLFALTEDAHGDIIATGYANRPDPVTGIWKGQAVLLKVNSMGCFGEGGCNDSTIVHSVVTGIESPPSPQAGSGVAVSPVKVAWLGYGELAVFYNLPATPAATLHLYDVHGRHIATQTLPPSAIFTPLQTPPLPPGIYLYTAEQGGTVVARGKVAVVR